MLYSVIAVSGSCMAPTHEVRNDEKLYRSSHAYENDGSRHVLLRLYRFLGIRRYRIESDEYYCHDAGSRHDGRKVEHVCIVNRFRIYQRPGAASTHDELYYEYYRHDESQYRSYNVDVVDYSRHAYSYAVADRHKDYGDDDPRPYRDGREHDVEIQSTTKIAYHRQQKIVEHQTPSRYEAQLRTY